MKLRSIPPITATGKGRVSSLDPVRFRSDSFGRIKKQESFKISPLKKTETTKSNLTLENLLAETEIRLRKVMIEMKKTCIDELLDEYIKLDDVKRQLKLQIIIQKAKG